MAEEPRRGRSRKRARRGKGRAGPGAEPLAQAVQILEALNALGDTLAARRGLDAREAASMDSVVVPLVLRFGVAGRNATLGEDGARLVAHLTREIEERIQARSAFVEGRVYCFFCGCSDCAHARPPDPLDTFCGYSALGKPQWQSFPNFCIALGERRVDAIYGDPPEIIAVLQEAQDLDADRLPGFGRNRLAFNVLGQVVAGLVPDNFNPARPSNSRVAWTIQVLETRSGNGSARLRLNMIGLSMWNLLEAAAEAGRREAPERLRRTIASTRRRVEALGRRIASAERRGESFDLEEAVRPILSRLRTEVERDLRESSYRTQHARVRHRSVSRPTGNAIRDARSVTLDRLLFDSARSTIVVLGPRGRTHVFTREGRHVTSMQLNPGELERKLHRGRWQPLEPSAAQAFVDTVRTLGRSGEEGEGGPSA